MGKGPGAALRAWREAGRTTSFRGHAVFYRDEGDGPPLLCIHGFPTASWDWHAVWPALVARHRLVAPDMLGFGFSAKPRGHDYTIAEQADLHEAVLRELGVERVHVLAHDYGDTVAQELLARREERRGTERPDPAGFELASVCFLNGGLFPEAHRARPVQTLLAGPLGPLLARLMSERRFRAGFAAIFGPDTQPSDAELADFWHLVSRDGGTRNAPRLLRYMEERRLRRERWVGALQTTDVPLRLVDGAEDPVSGRHMAERYREGVSHPDVVVLEGIGHYPQVEAPAAVVRELRAFHARLGAG